MSDEAFDRWRDLLHEEADRREPDSARIWARVEAAMAGPPPAPRRDLRVAGAMIATAAAIIAGFVFTLESASVPATRPVPAPVLPLPERSVTPSGTPSTPSVDGTVTAVGVVDPRSSAYWAQNNLRLRVRRPVTRLEIVIRVVRSDRVRAAGSWLSFPNADFAATTEVVGTSVVYRWRLKDGRTVRPGDYTVAAQYTRGAVHDVHQDAYEVRAPDRTVEGRF